MKDSLCFIVPGPPVPYERAARSGKKSYTPPRSAEYRQRIGLAVNHAMTLKRLGSRSSMGRELAWVPSTKGPFAVEMYFYRARDAGDIDNFIKQMDALTQAKVWSDDKHVHRLVAEMFVDRDNPRTEIRIIRMGE